MSSPQSPQKQSAERIRERFLHKIGIDAPHSNLQDNQTVATTNAVSFPQCVRNSQPTLPQAPSSCLGDVTPFYETLKVGLDDDTSMEDEDDDYFNDEDFYIGEDCAFEQMAMEKPAAVALSPSATEVLAQEPTTTPQILSSHSAQTAIVSDEGSSQSETSSSSIDASSMTSYLRSSCGSLTHASQDSGTSIKIEARKKSKRRVSLDNDVAVVPIPMRDEYTGHMRERLWSSPAELYQNAARNSIEFAAEGWNWRTVTEDENMLVCTQTNELIHPIHLMNAMANAESSPENLNEMPQNVDQPPGQAIAQPSG